MILALIVFPMCALLAVAAFMALVPEGIRTDLLPAVRTVAAISAAVVFIARIWGGHG
ncbi:hypothetical protein [Streptomyces sp. NPDC050738]|uniref:hypothetical protein n=1 Tax=Streptomyces sp. NPDC050738 TaxID=3154744 RepID=UPI00341ED516